MSVFELPVALPLSIDTDLVIPTPRPRRLWPQVSADDLQRVKAGDESAFARLVSTETSYLRHYARQWLFDADDVEDVVQTTWFRVWAARDKLVEATRWKRWVTIVCRNACVDVIRRRRKTVTFPLVGSDDALAFDPPAQNVCVVDMTFSDETLNAILALPVRQRLVVIWRYMAGKSTIETAHLLRCSPGTVKAALSQALKSLRGKLTTSPTEGLVARSADWHRSADVSH